MRQPPFYFVRFSLAALSIPAADQLNPGQAARERPHSGETAPGLEGSAPIGRDVGWFPFQSDQGPVAEKGRRAVYRAFQADLARAINQQPWTG